jgi:hypothetical protein
MPWHPREDTQPNNVTTKTLGGCLPSSNLREIAQELIQNTERFFRSG